MLIPLNALEAVAGLVADPTTAKQPSNGQSHSSPDRSRLNVEKWLASKRCQHGPRETTNDGRSKWKITCPFNADHGLDAAIMQSADGALAFKCFHNGCSSNGWQQAKDAIGRPDDDHYDPPRPRKKPLDEADLCEYGIDSNDREHGNGFSAAAMAIAAPLREMNQSIIAEQQAQGKTLANKNPGEWGAPKPLPSGIPPVMPFDPKLLPWSFEGWLTDIAERTQAPIDFSAVAAMSALSAVVGGRVGIRPKVQDDWLVIPNLWGMAIGRPGVMKSQAIQEAYRPLTRLEIEAGKRHEVEMKEFAALEMVAEARKKAAQKEVEKAVKNRDPAAAVEVAQQAINSDLVAPVRRRYLGSDATVEKLGEILRDNPNGIGLLRDELLGLLKSLERDGAESSRAFLLEGWDGNGRFAWDRIGRGTIVVDGICLSIFGGIQPGPLGDYQRAAARNGAEADGLLQRFQLAVYPDISAEWLNVDRWPDSDAKSLAYSVFTTLDKLTAADVGARTDDDDPAGVPYLRFDPAAQEAFNAWRAQLEPQLRSDAEHPAIASHLGKYRSLVPSLALLTHLAEGQGGPVGIEPLNKALGWARYLESHARRIFAVAVGDDIQGAKSLADKLQEGILRDGFALREVYRHGWSGLTTKEDAGEAVGLLCDLDWLRESPGSKSKRQRWDVNPNIKRTA